MSPQAQPRPTLPDYLTFDRAAEGKHEYLDGEIFAMEGASEPHNLIVTNVVGELRQQLKGRPCKVYPSDMRLRVPATGFCAYPDVVVVCGEARFADEQRDTLVEATLLVEVLSDSTEAYDRGTKFEHYRKLTCLAEFLLIAQDRPYAERYTRHADGGWRLSEARGLEGAIELPSIDCRLELAEVYDKVELVDRRSA